MDVKWYNEGEIYFACFTESPLIAIFYAVDINIWRWEFRLKSQLKNELIRCGTQHSFDSAKDAAWTLLIKESE